MNSNAAPVLACLAQFGLCVGGGFWVGYLAEPDAVGTAATGAIGLGGALFLAWAAAHAAGLVIGTGQFARQVALRVAAGGEPGAGDAHAERVRRDDRTLRRIMAGIAAVVLVAGSGLAALGVWLVADAARFATTLAACTGIAVLAAGLMPMAQRAVGEIRWGAPPP